ncbi:LYR motif-containing protein [Lachnellula subtilissima]|uniref:LYR motif-containing protein 2 n=1 Tax=Lachnellula subtilissima TaxID=602034 RepID=A0A8H8RAA8_9HELO|nr:LYR motif-containing protein [Lachnellula subtilissima]
MRSWHLLSRFYSSQAKRPSRFAEGTVSLDHFLQRGRALALWRTIVRGCRNISDEGTREETMRFAREEFRRNKDVRDLTQIRYLISTGKTQWEGMERYITGL